MSNEKLKIVILGGSVYSLSIAGRIKRINENTEVTIIEESDFVGTNSVILPLIASGEIKNDAIINGNEENITNMYDVKILKKHKATEINREKKEIILKNLDNAKSIQIQYDKLLLTSCNKGTVNAENIKKFINVYSLKNTEDAISIHKYIEKTSAKEVVLVGINFLSTIAANSFLKQGFNVTFIDKKSVFLENFDKEFDYSIKNEFNKNGIKLYLDSEIKDFLKSDKEKIAKIRLSNNIIIEAHVIILFDSLIPNLDLVLKAGIEVKNKNFIKVNEKFQTSDANIFAIGNLIENYNYVTKNYEKIYLTYNDIFKQARIVSLSILNINSSYKGIIDTKIVCIKNKAFASTGLNINLCKKYNLEFIPVTLYTGNHERFIPGVKQLHIKILVNKKDRKILGAQGCGEIQSISKKIDIIAMAILANLTVDDLINADFLYLPEINTMKDPLNILGMIASGRLDGYSNSLDLENISFNQNSHIIDVRSEKDFAKSHLEYSVCIPLKDLRKRINEIPKEKKIYIYGHTGQEGYIAERILKGNGINDVYSIDGGINSIKLFEKIV